MTWQKEGVWRPGAEKQMEAVKRFKMLKTGIWIQSWGGFRDDMEECGLNEEF